MRGRGGLNHCEEQPGLHLEQEVGHREHHVEEELLEVRRERELDLLVHDPEGEGVNHSEEGG